MSFNMKNVGNLLKKMQDDMEKAQAELAETQITGTDPSNKVTCKVNGHREIIEIKIDKSIVDPEDVEQLEDLILFSVRDAMTKAEKLASERMGSVTKGLPNIPGLQMPF